MKELALKRLTNLFTVKSIVTITLTITFCVLECCGSLSQDYMTIYTAVRRTRMYNSREIGELRADVAVNCRTLIERAAARGLPVLVVQTVRDAEYQRYLVSMGYAARTATVPTFHAKGVGLAFDICKNVKGHEYDDPGFFTAMGRLGKEMGFTWGGDWRSFPDRPHFQWDGGGKYTSSMVRAGRYPPPMLRFEEEETMTQEQFNTLMEGYWRSLAQREPADWSAEAREWAEKNGLIVGDGNGNKQYRSFVTREQLAVFLKRLRELEK